jgi:LPS-assembly lipoprotein
MTPAKGLSRRGALSLGACAALAGCGFEPIYMRTASGEPGPAQRDLAAVSVGIIPDRPGQLLRQELQDRFGSDGGNVPPRYKLNVSYSIAGQGIAILQSSAPTRVRMIATANWTLTAADGGQKVTSGTAKAVDGFNILDQQYFAADLSTEQTQRRLAIEVADNITLELAVFFRRRAAVASR